MFINGELANQPSIREMIVANNRISRILGFTRSSKARPHRVDRRWPGKQFPCLVEDSKCHVTHLDDMVWSHRTCHIRGDVSCSRDAVETGYDAHIWSRASESLLCEQRIRLTRLQRSTGTRLSTALLF
ncbi:hypothetical protein DPM33_19060 [Mesorhizobium hawassense]|uniref:Uncharacterized protein n=1 Tax=Mesorhizobium hawassense TaxID=1209954 RepID=A0A330HLC4_9HYPH|nr:hypothetical protein DPM33_19060 [Mesorhizobium hawassense]